MKIFFLTSRVPYPINKGDKLRAYHQMRLLYDSHKIYLFSLNDEGRKNIDVAELNKISHIQKISYLSKLAITKNILNGIFTKLPFQTSFFFSKKIKKTLDEEINKFKPDLIFCQLIRMAKYIDDIKSIPRVIDYIDVLSQGLIRRKNTSNILLKPILKSEYNRVLKYEHKVFNAFGNGIIITKNDRDYLSFNAKNSVEIIPNGIDHHFFSPVEKEKDIDILFAGNMNYPPNIDAVLYFVKNVLPIVRITNPDINFYIVGATPSPKIKRLASRNVIITGWVNDIREYYSRAKVFIAPMQIGTGLQNKILEAMSMAVPCVISSLAQCGIGAKSPMEILVADDPVKFSEFINKILSDILFAKNLGTASRLFIQKNYSWDEIGAKLNFYLMKVVENR